MAKDKNYVSIWFWLLAFLVMAIPCIGFIMIFVWAFAGENESRKNHFRALLIWFAVVTLLWFFLMTLGFWPIIQQHAQSWIHRFLK